MRWLGAAALGAVLVVGAAGCDSEDTAAGSAALGVAPMSDYPDIAPGPVAMRRLTNAQLEATLLDLFGDTLVVPTVAEPDVLSSGLLAVGASQATYSARGVESMEEMAFTIAEQVFDGEDARAELAPCTPADAAGRDDACAEATLEALAYRAWRRPVTADEVAKLVDVAGAAASTLGDFWAGLEFGVAAVLQSPNFLFRTEVGEADASMPSGRRFTDFEMAARLSYFLWNTTPDAELMAAAEAGSLSTREGLLAQADRLLASPRARTGIRAFFEDYLHLYELDHLKKDPTVFEHVHPELGADAKEETLRLIEHVVFDADGDYRTLMTTDETFVNPRLAALYGIPAPSADGFARVRLPADSQRRGLLGHLSFLGHHSHAAASSATRRGVGMRTVLLCQGIPAPPVDVDTSIPEPSGTTLTLRDRVAEHLENPSCAGCHLLTDPIGLGLEQFDAMGRWRTTDNGAVIDATGDLDGQAFDGPKALGELIGAHPDFTRCVVRMMTRYATGRQSAPGEGQLVGVVHDRFEASGFRVQSMVRELIASPVFRDAGEAQ